MRRGTPEENSKTRWSASSEKMGFGCPRVGQLFFNVCLGLSEVIRHHEALDVNAVPDGPVVSGHLLSHSNSFGFEMEKDAAGCRALNRNYYCRSALRLSRTVLTVYSALCVEYSFVVRNIACEMRLLRISPCTSKAVSLCETDPVTMDIAVLLHKTKT